MVLGGLGFVGVVLIRVRGFMLPEVAAIGVEHGLPLLQQLSF